MKTPKEYSENVKKNIITTNMLADCLFSVNKRAKNCRDKEREYRNSRYDIHDNESKYRNQKEKYYQEKTYLLSILTPSCIHAEFKGYKKERVYDYEPDYDRYLKDFYYTSSYYDKDIQCVVEFGDVELKDSPKYSYYIYYEVGDNGFHAPIREEELSNYPQLKIININNLITRGHNTSDLLSTKFVQKVIKIIKDNNYTYSFDN